MRGSCRPQLGAKSAALAAVTLGEVALLGLSSVECILDVGMSFALFGLLAVLGALAVWAYLSALLTQHVRCDEVWERVDQRAHREGPGINAGLDESIHGTPTCEACDEPQLPRSQHCAACDSCVMRFELHSAWLGKCVGLANLKLYVLAHIFFALFCAAVLAVHAARLGHSRFFPGAVWLILAASAAYIACAHLFFSARLAGLHAWLIATGRTEHEWRSGDRRSHDAGLRSNLASVLGSETALALLPVAARFDELRLEWFVARPKPEKPAEDDVEENEERGQAHLRLLAHQSPAHNQRAAGGVLPAAAAGDVWRGDLSGRPQSQERARAWLQDSSRFPRSAGAFLNPELSDDHE